MQVAPRIVDPIASAERVESVALAGMQLPREVQRVEHRYQAGNPTLRLAQPRELRVEKAEVERSVVHDKFRVADKRQQFVCDVREPRLLSEKLRP